jgi:hypothetical protein
VSRRKEPKRRWEAEQERQHAEDLAQADRIGADFGLGELRTTRRYRQARSARTRAVRQLFWYSGGLAQPDLDEPEPRVLRWDEVDSFTPLIYDDSGCVAGCRLRGRTGTEVTVSLGYGLRYLVGEADRMLTDRLVPELVGAYDAARRSLPAGGGSARPA